MGGFILDQLSFHPRSVGLALLTVVVCVALILTKSAADRPRALPAVLCLALVAMSGGVAASVYETLLIFRGMAITGSGGEGAVAAGLSGARVASLIWLAGAILVLASGLALTAKASSALGSSESEPEATRPIRLLDVVLPVATGVSALVGYEAWFVGSFPRWLQPSSTPVGEISEMVAGHVVRLKVLSIGAILVSLGLAIFAAVVAAKKPTSRSITKRWQLTLGGLVLFCLAAAAFAVWQCSVFYAAAISGRF